MNNNAGIITGKVSINKPIDVIIEEVENIELVRDDNSVFSELTIPPRSAAQWELYNRTIIPTLTATKRNTTLRSFHIGEYEPNVFMSAVRYARYLSGVAIDSLRLSSFHVSDAPVSNMRAWRNKISIDMKSGGLGGLVNLVVVSDNTNTAYALMFILANLQNTGNAIVKLPMRLTTRIITGVHHFAGHFAKTRILRVGNDCYIYGEDKIKMIYAETAYALCSNVLLDENKSLYNVEYLRSPDFNVFVDLIKHAYGAYTATTEAQWKKDNHIEYLNLDACG